jgi:hypothetical protein
MAVALLREVSAPRTARVRHPGHPLGAQVRRATNSRGQLTTIPKYDEMVSHQDKLSEARRSPALPAVGLVRCCVSRFHSFLTTLA